MVNPASYGAFDLTQLAQQSPTQESAVGLLPVTDADFNRFSELSKQVPTVFVFVGDDPSSSQLLQHMQVVESRMQRKILFGKVTQSAAPQVFAAFQVVDVPMTIALVNQRPVPLFAGMPQAEQIDQVLTQLLQVCAQAGVTGTIDAPEQAPQTPKEYEPALEAEAAQDWERAVKVWKKVIANLPADATAKQRLAIASINARLASGAEQGPLEQTDRAMLAGAHDAAMQSVLQMFSSKDADRDALRARLIEYFTAAGPGDEAVKAARAKLTAMLF